MSLARWDREMAHLERVINYLNSNSYEMDYRINQLWIRLYYLLTNQIPTHLSWKVCFREIGVPIVFLRKDSENASWSLGKRLAGRWVAQIAYWQKGRRRLRWLKSPLTAEEMGRFLYVRKRTISIPCLVREDTVEHLSALSLFLSERRMYREEMNRFLTRVYQRLETCKSFMAS